MHLPETRETLKQAIAVRIDLGPALIATTALQRKWWNKRTSRRESSVSSSEKHLSSSPCCGDWQGYTIAAAS